MPIYTIIQIETITKSYTDKVHYEVEADSKEEAQKLHFNRDSIELDRKTVSVWLEDKTKEVVSIE